MLEKGMIGINYGDHLSATDREKVDGFLSLITSAPLKYFIQSHPPISPILIKQEHLPFETVPRNLYHYKGWVDFTQENGLERGNVLRPFDKWKLSQGGMVLENAMGISLEQTNATLPERVRDNMIKQLKNLTHQWQAVYAGMEKGEKPLQYNPSELSLQIKGLEGMLSVPGYFMAMKIDYRQNALGTLEKALLQCQLISHPLWMRINI